MTSFWDIQQHHGYTLRKTLLSSLDICMDRWNIRAWTIESDYIDIYIKLYAVTHGYNYRVEKSLILA